MTDLHQVLTEATEHVASPDLAGRALAGAHRQRVRRAAAAAIAAVVLVGGGVAWTVQDRVPHAGVVDIPGPTPTPSTEDGDPATQAVWDPFMLPDVPRVPSVLSPLLVPPEDPPALEDSPLPDVVVAWPEVGTDLRLLGTDGEWRSVTGTATAVRGMQYDILRPAISPDGRRVAMATNDGVLVVDATTGTRRVVPWPHGLDGPRDLLPRVLWRPGAAGLVVVDWRKPWLVDLEGRGSPLMGGGEASELMIDPDDGTLRDRDRRSGRIRTWRGADDISSVRFVGYGERFVTRFGRVAYAGNPGPFGMAERSGPVVLDPDTGTVLGYAPIEDPDSVYSDNGYLTPLGFLAPDTVLLMVGPMDFRTMELGDETRHLVSWNYVTGDFGLVASGHSRMSEIAVAPALVLGD